MDNISLLTKINSISESLDPHTFSDIIFAIQDLIKSEKEKQELKEVIDEVISGLILITYELEDENLESEFYKLLDDLVNLGFDMGKILIKELSTVKNSEKLTKVIAMLETIVKASPWIRKISLAQRLHPVIQDLLSQSLPIRIKEILKRLDDSTKPFLKNKEKLNLHSTKALPIDKNLVIQEWMKSPELFIGLDPVIIQGIPMLDFFTREVNFEIILDYILFSQEYGKEVLSGIRKVFQHFKKFKKFNPEKKIAESINSALASNSSEFTVIQSVRLITYLMDFKGSNFISHVVGNGTILMFVKSLNYSEVQSFLFVKVLANSALSMDTQSTIKNSLLPEIFKKFTQILEGGLVKDAIFVLEMLVLIIPEVLREGYFPKSDGFEAGELLKMNRYRKVLITTEGRELISAIFKVAFESFWCSSNSEDLQELQIMASDLIIIIIKSARNFKPLQGILSKTITEVFLFQIQANILHYSLKNNKSSFRLPCMLVTRPVGTHMLQLARTFTEVIKFSSELIKKVSTNCWSTFFLWFFVLKNNAMMSNIIVNSIELFLDHAEEKRIKEVMIDKRFLPRIVETLLAKQLSDEKDFFVCCKKAGKKVFEYAEGHKTKFTRDILSVPGWKTLFPPSQEVFAKLKPASRSCKRGHTFVLGLNPLEKAPQKPVVKSDYEIEHLASQLDLIYKINPPN